MRCTVCNQSFSRQWNLKRHIQDVHKLHNYDKKDNIMQKDNDFNNLPFNIYENNNFKDTNNKNDINNNQNQHYYNSFPDINHDLYYNVESYQYPYSNFTNSNFESQLKKEKRLSVDDKIKIQKGLKILENHLEKICKPVYIFRIIKLLNYRCLSEKSDEPLKKYLVQNNIGYLWTF